MRLLVRPIPGTAGPEQVLRRLGSRSRRLGVPGPAALTGDWFAGGAVLAPSLGAVCRQRPFALLDDLPEVHVPGDVPPGAVGGGWFGYLGYGLTDPGTFARPLRLPHAAWGWTDHVLRRDRDGQWWFEALVDETHVDHGVPDDLDELVAAPPERDRSSWRAGAVTEPDAQRHHKAVRRCVEEIAAGEIFQANVCSRFSVPFDGDPLELFAVGSDRFHPARAAYVGGDWGAVASLSPELFLSRHGDVVRSSPIKGTTPRRGPADDGNAQKLRESVKDVAENVMIVDMARNDLGRVAEVGSVTTPRLLDVQPHPGVWHLVSEVRAELPAGVANSELLAATFPPASVTGAPKHRALEIIADLESQPREVYCGAVGVASPVAGTELNVAIRTLEAVGGELQFGVGGGITADSDAEQEWHECLTKAAPLLSLLEPRGE